MIGLVIFGIVCCIIVWILFGLACGKIAGNKGYESGWYILGFLFGIIALLIVLCLPDNYAPSYSSSPKKVIHNTSGHNESRVIVWKCPKCGNGNTKFDRFCPKCGEEMKEEYLLKHTSKWVCHSCGRTNSPENKYCSNCGKEKESIEENVISNNKLEENGKECGMCGKKTLTLTNVKIVDSMGTRYRKVCPECLDKYNCIVIDEKE